MDCSLVTPQRGKTRKKLGAQHMRAVFARDAPFASLHRKGHLAPSFSSLHRRSFTPGSLSSVSCTRTLRPPPSSSRRFPQSAPPAAVWALLRRRRAEPTRLVEARGLAQSQQTQRDLIGTPMGTLLGTRFVRLLHQPVDYHPTDAFLPSRFGHRDARELEESTAPVRGQPETADDDADQVVRGSVAQGLPGFELSEADDGAGSVVHGDDEALGVEAERVHALREHRLSNRRQVLGLPAAKRDRGARRGRRRGGGGARRANDATDEAETRGRARDGARKPRRGEGHVRRVAMESNNDGAAQVKVASTPSQQDDQWRFREFVADTGAGLFAVARTHRHGHESVARAV